MAVQERTASYNQEDMIYKKLSRTKHARDDGWLAELVSLNYNDVPFADFHSYLVVIKPGKFRARHYHKKKGEWLALTSGELKIMLENIETKKNEKIVLSEYSDDYNLVYIPPKVAHAVKNIGKKNASLVVFSKTPEIPGDTIEYKMEV